MLKELIVQRDPKSPISEVFRTLRTNIQFMNTNKHLKTLLVTSTVPEEGKSVVAANLAVTFAQENKRVVLIDCDMRKGRQHHIFGTMSKPGLSNYLSGITETGGEGSTDLARYIKGTEVRNLYILPSGNIPPNPSELISSEKMVKLLDELKSICDIIILDGTPSLIVTDSILLSRIADSTLIVTSQNETRLDDLNKVKKDIENVGGRIAGVVINKVAVNTKEYQSKYYYYGNRTNLPEKKRQSVSTGKSTLYDTEKDITTEDVRIPKKSMESIEKTAQGENAGDGKMTKTDDILASLNEYLTTEKK